MGSKIIKSLLFRINKTYEFFFFKFFKSFTKTVIHNDVSVTFKIINDLSLYRANSFSTKEPLTLKWIDKFKDNSCFWDIGANIGIYSIYAKKKHASLKVIACEPSFLNLNLLSDNININYLSNEIIILPFPLSNNNIVGNFLLGDTRYGGANSNFLDTKKNIKNSYNYLVSGFKGDHIIDNLNLSKPDYIKIDVDGNEMIVLNGLEKYLHDISSILIEIDDPQQDINFLINYFKKFNLVYDTKEEFLNYKTINYIFVRGLS